MKVYIACVDHDRTMRSVPEPERAFSSFESAKKYLEDTYNFKVEKRPKEPWTLPWKILPMELLN